MREVADMKQISESSTLRKSCLFYIESKLAPLVAFMLAKLDLYNNADLLFANDAENGMIKMMEPERRPWVRDMWLWAMNTPELLRLAYEEMRSEDQQRKEFECRQAQLTSTATIKTIARINIPFVWIVINKLSDLCESFVRTRSSAGGLSVDARGMYVRNVVRLFEDTPQFKFIELCQSKRSLDLYIRDFLLLKSHAQDTAQIGFISGTTNSLI